jgi:hypothetical protein
MGHPSQLHIVPTGGGDYEEAIPRRERCKKKAEQLRPFHQS